MPSIKDSQGSQLVIFDEGDQKKPVIILEIAYETKQILSLIPFLSALQLGNYLWFIKKLISVLKNKSFIIQDDLSSFSKKSILKHL